MLMWVFRGIRPILGGTIVIATGLLTASAALLLCFQHIHLLTLVFGTTLIGISVDYAFHFYAKRAVEPLTSGAQTVAGIRPAIRAGLITSLLSFAGMALVDLGLLRQMAVFAAGGLLGAYLTVIWLLPNTALVDGIGAGRMFDWAKRIDAVSVVPSLRWLVSGLLAIALGGVLRLQANDDVRLLGTDLPDLVEKSQRIDLFQPESGQLGALMISTETPDAALQRLERLLPELRRMQANGTLMGFFALSELLPSARRQQDNYKLYGAMLNSAASARLFENLYLNRPDVARLRARYAASAGRFATTKDLHGALLPSALTELLSCKGGHCSLLIPVVTNRSGAMLANWAKQHPDVRVIDNVEMVTQGLSKVRSGATLLLIYAYAFIFLYLSVKFGPMQAGRLLVAPLMALVVCLGVLGWMGVGFNLFHLVGLIVMLGIAVDYSIFYLNESGERVATTAAVWLSAMTSILAFGLLGASHTPALASFGSMLLLGISAAVLVTPMCVSRQTPPNRRELQ